MQIKNTWRLSESWSTNISRLTTGLTTWNWEVYENLFWKKRHLLGRIEGIDRKLLEGPNERLAHLKQDLWTQYNSLLDHEEAFWFQQARSKWIRLGDRNTRYFHQKNSCSKKG